MAQIPRTIHQIWIGDQSRCPIDLITSIKEMNPTWNHILWTEENLPKDLRLQPLIDAVPFDDMSAKADLIRYEILYRHGGFYVDADSLGLKPFPDFLLDNDSFACYDNEHFYPGYIANGYLGAVQGNYFLGRLINHLLNDLGIDYIKSMPINAAADTTGPWLFTRYIKKTRYNYMTIYPSHYFIPVHYHGLVSPLRHLAYCEHLAGSTQSSIFDYNTLWWNKS